MDTLGTEAPPPPIAADPDERREPAARGNGGSRADGAAPVSQFGSLLFADIVHAHYVWERERHGDDPERVAELRREYEGKLADLCAAEGGILEVYWCTLEPSAVMLTQGAQTRWQRYVGAHPLRLHRVTNWLMPRAGHQLVGLLHDCDDLALQAGENLRGAPRRIALRSAFELESELLAFIERTRGRPSQQEITEFVTDATGRVAEARADYDNAADKIARMVYVTGMLAGVALLLPIAVLAGLAIKIFGALDLHALGVQAFYACMTAGALGAVVSVLSRMSSPAKFGLDPAVGRRSVFFLGLLRPFVGSIFGLALYFLLQSSLVQASTNNRFATYVVVAFIGGFSERFTKVMLNNAETAVSGGATTAGTKAE
jgi:hypothetical protein